MRGILRFAITMVMITTTVAFFVPVVLTTHKQSRRVGVMTMLGMFGKKSAGGNKKTFTVTVQQKFYKNAELEVEAGAPVNLRKELMKNKIDIYPLQGKIYNCGGGGQCGTCAIQIIKGAKNLKYVICRCIELNGTCPVVFPTMYSILF